MTVLLSASLNMSTNLENQAVATGMEKVRFHSNAKECSNYGTIALTSQARKGMLKILQARGPDVQAGFRKGKGTRHQIANIDWTIKKKKNKRVPENIHFCFIDYANAFDCVDHNKLWKILEKMV